jgi:hypothetical protein
MLHLRAVISAIPRCANKTQSPASRLFTFNHLNTYSKAGKEIQDDR